MSEFSLTVKSFTPPPLPSYEGVPVTQIRSGLLSNPTVVKSPLVFTASLGPRGLHPATHLQAARKYEGTGTVFVPDLITAKDLVKVEDDVYGITIPAEQVWRAKVNEGETDTGELLLHAWKREKLLSTWSIGKIEGLGLVGYKSTDLARRRVEVWKQDQRETHSETNDQ